MGYKYDSCTNAECVNGRMTVAGREMECPVCEGEGFLDTRMSDLLGEPEVRARLDGLLDLPEEKLS